MHWLCGVAGGQQGMPVRPLMQTGVRPVNNQPFVDGADKHPADAVARLLASGVADHHRLPNIPAQLAKTVDEIECAAAPPAANWRRDVCRADIFVTRPQSTTDRPTDDKDYCT